MMKSKALRIIIPVLLFVVCVVNVGYFIHNAFFYSLDGLPQGTLSFPVMSPDGKKHPAHLQCGD